MHLIASANFVKNAFYTRRLTMKSTMFQAADGFQEVPLAELSSVEGGGKISFKLGLIGIAIGNALGGESGGAVGWSVGNAIGSAVESVIDFFT